MGAPAVADELERPAMQGAAIITFVAVQRKPRAGSAHGIAKKAENSSFDSHLQR
jgi:hypothetical protein